MDNVKQIFHPDFGLDANPIEIFFDTPENIDLENFNPNDYIVEKPRPQNICQPIENFNPHPNSPLLT